MDPKLTTILKTLRIRQIDVEESTGGIRINFIRGSGPTAIDIYALRSNPDHLRAKIRGADETSEMSDSELRKVRIKLQNELLGVANVGSFTSLGRRGEAHYYYAHITMSKKSSTDLTLVQKGAQQALEQLKGIDSGSFRKGLDQLGLPRSSKVRLALTRIFRESADIEEMLTVVVQEAGIIAKSNDWRVLKDIRERNEIPYLNIVVELLWKAVAKERLIKTLEDIHN